jgi:hypothetical protein
MLQDPNIICIDNLIDDEITREAIRVSITGRLVISSIYTKNAYTTIDNLLNMEIENYLLGSNLNGIISQRLVKQLCPKCKEKRYTTEYERTILKRIYNQDIKELYYPKGCDECHNGYIGQIPIVEVVEITDEIRSAITNKKDRKTIRELLYKDNTPIMINGFDKVLEGTTSFNEIIRMIDVKIDLNENQKDLKDYILGNTTTLEPIQNQEETPNNEVQVIEQPTIENSEPIEEQQPIVVDEIVEETPQVVEVQEEQITPEEEKTIIEEQQDTQTSEQQLPTEGQRLIDEINDLFKDDSDEFNILAEMLSDNDDQTDETPTTSPLEEEENVEEETTIEEIIAELEEQPVEISSEEITREEPTPIEENEIEQTKEVPTPIEESTIESTPENEIKQEINVPTPIEANVIEEKPTPTIEEDEDDDDEDDFGYGAEYENSF